MRWAVGAHRRELRVEDRLQLLRPQIRQMRRKELPPPRRPARPQQLAAAHATGVRRRRVHARVVGGELRGGAGCRREALDEGGLDAAVAIAVVDLLEVGAPDRDGLVAAARQPDGVAVLREAHNGTTATVEVGSPLEAQQRHSHPLRQRLVAPRRELLEHPPELRDAVIREERLRRSPRHRTEGRVLLAVLPQRPRHQRRRLLGQTVDNRGPLALLAAVGAKAEAAASIAGLRVEIDAHRSAARRAARAAGVVEGCRERAVPAMQAVGQAALAREVEAGVGRHELEADRAFGGVLGRVG